MPFLEVAQNRYTTKTYNGEIIPEETLHVLKEILCLAPSSINSQPWQFIFVGDEHKNEIFAPLSLMNEERVKQASHIVIFRVLESVEHFEEEAPSYISEGGRTFYQQYIKPQGEAHVKAWMEHQVYVALGYFLSAYAIMGIDSTAMEGILPQAYDQHLPKDGYQTLFAVAIGYRDPEDKNQPSITPKKRKESVVKDL
ncbi:nitroreductase family protein [Capnocytophaga gingivalis]